MDKLNRLDTISKKKISASSIIETLVASAIIILIFTIATVTLNTTLGNVIENDTQEVEKKITEISYQSRHEKIKIPDKIDTKNWLIQLTKEAQNNINFLVFEAIHKRTKKKIVKTVIYNEY
jgi:predicted PurR-regulated permease PerM